MAGKSETAELKRLRDALPQTADGWTIVPGEKLFWLFTVNGGKTWKVKPVEVCDVGGVGKSVTIRWKLPGGLFACPKMWFSLSIGRNDFFISEGAARTEIERRADFRVTALRRKKGKRK